jgi:hypothetical protein
MIKIMTMMMIDEDAYLYNNVDDSHDDDGNDDDQNDDDVSLQQC